MNPINQPEKKIESDLSTYMKKLSENKIIPDWIRGLKRIYDIYFEIQSIINEEL